MKQKTKDILKVVGASLLLCAFAGGVAFAITQSISEEIETRAESENITQIEEGVTYLLTPNQDFDSSDNIYNGTGLKFYYGDFIDFSHDLHFNFMTINTYDNDFVNAKLYDSTGSIDLCNANDGWLYEASYIYKPDRNYTSETSKDLLLLYNVTVYKPNTVKFLDTLNYNAFLQSGARQLSNIQVRGKYPFIAYGEVNYPHEVITLDIADGFYSNGEYYSSIKTTVDLATVDINFLTSTGEVVHSHLISNSQPYKYVRSISYYNKYTLQEVQVATRPLVANGDGTYVYYDMVFASIEYKTIEVIDLENDKYAKTVLEMTANNIEYNNISETVNTADIGLGQAFTLIGSAFNSLLGLATIQVIPGITIGLLLFMPFLAGLVVFIIWIVKR